MWKLGPRIFKHRSEMSRYPSSPGLVLLNSESTNLDESQFLGETGRIPVTVALAGMGNCTCFCSPPIRLKHGSRSNPHVGFFPCTWTHLGANRRREPAGKSLSGGSASIPDLEAGIDPITRGNANASCLFKSAIPGCWLHLSKYVKLYFSVAGNLCAHS
jgi:hypothetical protein